MKIVDERRDNTGFVSIENFEFGDVVEDAKYHVFLVVWVNQKGQMHCQNPGYKSLLYLKGGRLWYEDTAACPLVRRLAAELVIRPEEA